MLLGVITGTVQMDPGAAYMHSNIWVRCMLQSVIWGQEQNSPDQGCKEVVGGSCSCAPIPATSTKNQSAEVHTDFFGFVCHTSGTEIERPDCQPPPYHRHRRSCPTIHLPSAEWWCNRSHIKTDDVWRPCWNPRHQNLLTSSTISILIPISLFLPQNPTPFPKQSNLPSSRHWEEEYCRYVSMLMEVG